ncbi:MAG TPA: hypothetical protein VIT44_17730 [Cyclobacteriaceae bacterium]
MSNRAHAYPYYQSALLSSDLTELDEEILAIISVYQPISAKHIASQLSVKHKFPYSRRDVNSRLFKTLSTYLTQDDYFRWSLQLEGLLYPDQEEDPEKEHYTEDLNVVNLDSTTKIKYFNGKVLKIKFTKVNSSKSNGPQVDIFYIYYKSPLAQALLTKKAGDICFFLGGRCEVLEID